MVLSTKLRAFGQTFTVVLKLYTVSYIHIWTPFHGVKNNIKLEKEKGKIIGTVCIIETQKPNRVLCMGHRSSFMTSLFYGGPYHPIPLLEKIHRVVYIRGIRCYRGIIGTFISVA
jgi:hypothetical protein